MLNLTVVITLYMIAILILEYRYFLFNSKEFPLISKKVFKLRLRIKFTALAFLSVANPHDSFGVLCIKVAIGLLFLIPYYFINFKKKFTYYFHSTDAVNICEVLHRIGDDKNITNFYSTSPLDEECNIIKIELLNLQKNVRKQIIRELRIKTTGSLKNIEAFYWIEFFVCCFLIVSYFSAMYVLFILRS